MGKEGNGDTIVLTLAFTSEAERNAVYVNIINQVIVNIDDVLEILFRVALLF